MIKNIIFDLGNVLIRFQPADYLKETGLNEKEAEFINREIYQSREWIELDRGIISRKEALKSVYARNPLKKQLLEQHSDFMKVLTPIECNTHLPEELKAAGYKIFYLTNYHKDLFSRTVRRYDFFHFFDGGVVSAHVKHIKPEPEIYNILLEKYDLLPEESLFIDDSENNTKAAEKIGLNVIHLTDPKTLENQLNIFLHKK